MKKIISSLLFSALCAVSYAQTDSNSTNLDDLFGDASANEKVYANNAFKSTRVVMGQSMEMLGAGVLDSRILHRFGLLSGGLEDMFGLDAATMRMGFDYGINKNLMIGIGRSTTQKEIDGFIKYRIAHQHTGPKAIPVSILYVAGTSIRTKPSATLPDGIANKMAYYHQVIVGRKFSNSFSLQLSPTFLHQNYYTLPNTTNDMVAIGVGTRYKLTERVAAVLDAFPTVYGAVKDHNRMPISLGFDIETGGHVFQLHFSNAKGMAERAFLADTRQDWGKGEVQFGFNLSRVFTVKKNTASSW
jgi:hypothetical protein